MTERDLSIVSSLWEMSPAITRASFGPGVSGGSKPPWLALLVLVPVLVLVLVLVLPPNRPVQRSINQSMLAASSVWRSEMANTRRTSSRPTSRSPPAWLLHWQSVHVLVATVGMDLVLLLDLVDLERAAAFVLLVVDGRRPSVVNIGP